jgi:hypothetical protein
MKAMNNKFFWIVVGLTGAMLLIGVGGKFFVDRVADVVIDKLKKDYSPSPYGPGIDPDKIDANKFKK